MSSNLISKTLPGTEMGKGIRGEKQMAKINNIIPYFIALDCAYNC